MKGRPPHQTAREIAMKRIGIFGGTFDPVHWGHISLAKDAAEQAALDQVVFVPARRQPFKLDKKITSGADRLQMLKIATEGAQNLAVSSYELDADGISYTYLTMRAMQELYGKDAKLYFITGTDSFLKIETWKNAEELLSSYAYIVGVRPGYRQEELDACMERIRKRYGTEVRNIANVQVDVSSTEIRKLLEAGGQAQALIPAGVERYIKTHGLYR